MGRKDPNEGKTRAQLWISKELYDLWKSTVYRKCGVEKGILTKALEDTIMFWIDSKEGKNERQSSA
jgi:hypothetical protein